MSAENITRRGRSRVGEGYGMCGVHGVLDIRNHDFEVFRVSDNAIHYSPYPPRKLYRRNYLTSVQSSSRFALKPNNNRPFATVFLVLFVDSRIVLGSREQSLSHTIHCNILAAFHPASCISFMYMSRRYLTYLTWATLMRAKRIDIHRGTRINRSSAF